MPSSGILTRHSYIDYLTFTLDLVHDSGMLIMTSIVSTHSFSYIGYEAVRDILDDFQLDFNSEMQLLKNLCLFLSSSIYLKLEVVFQFP